MQNIAAAVTMVRDDAFFLKIWLEYYGGLLGRENCYVINHGRGETVAKMAEGCNVIGIPGDPHKNFDQKRSRLLNGVVDGLRGYYKHIIVGDVDELVVKDPSNGLGLLEFLKKRPAGQVMTPLGLEVIHRIDKEHDPITSHVLGPRRHVRIAMEYSKPCVISTPTKVARGGHYTRYETLNAPSALYLFHLKFCDFENYVSVMNHRNDVAKSVQASVKEALIGRHWFAEARGEDRAIFEGFADLEMKSNFDFKWLRQQMEKEWSPREDTGFWNFPFHEYPVQYEVPERFFGTF